MVLCQSFSSVQSGKLCDHVHMACTEARFCSRRIDVSNCLCLFEFYNESEAQAILGASIPDMTFTKAAAFFWVVESIDCNHIGHSQPYRECENNLYLTYAMKTMATAMSESGCSAGDIADYLTSRGSGPGPLRSPLMFQHTTRAQTRLSKSKIMFSWITFMFVQT